MFGEQPELGMEYNTQRGEMRIPEYGRNVQKMVQYCLSVEDREERNKVAHAIIEVIGNLNPHLRDVPDFKHKLWDHLFIMSGFKLDVDSPYPIPTEENFESKPDLLEYPSRNKRYRYYGKVAINMVEAVSELEDGEYKQAMIKAIADQMKKNYLSWNKDTVEDSLILEDLNKISAGRINTNGIQLVHISPPKKTPSKAGHHRRSNKKRYKK